MEICEVVRKSPSELEDIDPVDELFLTHAIIEKKKRDMQKWARIFGGK